MLAKLFSKKEALKSQMLEKRPLPMGMAEFITWSDRIISGAMIGADKESQRFALADMILHLNATEDFKEDGYFIKILRKVAVNQVAEAMRVQIRDAAKARLAKQEAEQAAVVAQPECEVKPTIDGGDNVLEKEGIQASPGPVVSSP